MTRHCDWTPRQGHACLSYGGSIFIMGGFDESGYCNDMHRLKVGAGEELNCAVWILPFYFDAVDH